MTINYNMNIPFSTNNPSVDQPNMYTNTNAINAIWDVDHYTFASGSGATPPAGTHSQVSLTNESAPGIPANCSGVLFANAVNGVSWPFWQNAGGIYQLLGGPNTANTAGQVFLPGGIIFIWNTITAGLNTTNLNVTFPFGGFPNNCFNVQLTSGITNNATIRMAVNSDVTPPRAPPILSKTGFQTQQTADAHLTALYYLAIGN